MHLFKTPVLIFLALFLVAVNPLLSQSKGSEPAAMPFVFGYYALQSPGGDMAERYGVSSEVGGGGGYKFKSNWLLSAEAGYIFGNNVNENTLINLINSDGQITNQYGEPSQVNVRQAGIQIKASVGRILPVLKSNANSGIFIRGSLGFLQHKIYIENVGNNTPQLLGEYRKGYDRMCNGLAVSEFIGWQNFSNKGGFHFLVGFEFTQGFTENRRTWDYATNTNPAGPRVDLLYAVKLAWFIPIRQREATGYFYY